ncbi:ATP-binding protein [Actinoplanes derwentensis]|uniref:Transcriptional regulatory protein, C terminal n=1 Tax=Actinoplanes derwentensis TaxID=113562 RepID=A0A1H1ZJY1_9ACTN|nr:BTAD domain-containing putative transcriptional regulator [Actinoplanes derwentensis]GID82460.1 hypothetical protein Ade03nite_13840 [Actinoplanes derwentensis]SDT33536.1 Transcriptional regulatory protein, C terminal [Actinoplanes derwentensis]
MATSDSPARGLGDALHLRILGPLEIRHGSGGAVALTGQQACLLALLLAREGRPVGVHELIDLIWFDGGVPASAMNILHKYVGVLRRVLEPALPARHTGSYLRRRGNGYLITADARTLDLAAFRAGVSTATNILAAGSPGAALDAYAQALDLWNGPAADGLICGPAAASVFAALNDELFDTCVAATQVALLMDQPQRVLRPLRLAAAAAPLHEAVQASLVVTLAAAGRQAEALSVFGTVRARLAEELGIDPGPALMAAHQRIVTAAPAPVAGPGTDTTIRAPGGHRLVGRAGELATLRRAVGAANAGRTGFVLLEGAAGSGKTRLLEEAVADAERSGALVAWGRSLDGAGSPSMWPWAQIAGALLETLPDRTRAERLGGEIGRIVTPGDSDPDVLRMPDEGTRFRLGEQIVALAGEVAAIRPVVLVLDDLQWADTGSLRLFGHLATRLPDRTALVGALRDRAPEPGSELVRLLAMASRVPGHRRIRLGPWSPGEVADFVRHEAGQDITAAAAQSIHTRTSGNPFFVRELTRLLADGGELTAEAASRAGVPATVRDIVRDRMADLDKEAGRLLHIAALLGRDVSLGLLAAAADLDPETCLARLDELVAPGLLEPGVAPSLSEPGAGDPFSFRFVHDLVRESVVETTTPLLATRLHLTIADALDRVVPSDGAVAERLAHHLRSAGPLADPARTTNALIRAGRHAATASALESAERHLRTAAAVARAAGLAAPELAALAQLTAVAGMRSGYHGPEPEMLRRAEHLARGLGLERQATEFLFARRAAHSQAAQLHHSGRLARRLLDQGRQSSDPVVRAYGLRAWGIHQWDIGHIGEAFRHLSQANQPLDDGLPGRTEQPLRHDLGLLSAGMLAETTALHGDLEAARTLLDRLEATAGDDPYAVTVRSGFAARIAAMAGDPRWARQAADQGIAEDPGFSYTFFGAYLRLARYWADAVTGRNPSAAAAGAQAVITRVLLDPPRSNLPTWYGLLAEMWLAAARPVEAAAALDRADEFLEQHGQRYAEGLLLLLRARLSQARGADDVTVRAEAEHARTVALRQEAHLFAQRASRFLADLDGVPAPGTPPCEDAGHGSA